MITAHLGAVRPGAPAASRRTSAAYLLGVTAGALSRVTGSGSGGTLPGRLVLGLAPDALERLATGRQILVVSGTNGKTTTTRFLAAALAAQGTVLTNSDGANQASGLVSTLLRGRRDPGACAVLEIDEMSLPAALAQLAPAVAVLLNLTRDQLDRTGEVAAHVVRWQRALAPATGTVVVANADDPLVTAAVLGARPDGQRVLWVGAGQPWRADCALCPVCRSPWATTADASTAGPWACGSCGFARPATTWSVEGDTVVAPDQPAAAAELRLPGRANVSNAAMAAAAAAQFGVALHTALAQMRTVVDVGGRYLRAEHHGASVRLLLAKNPAGWAEALTHLGDASSPVVIAVNARIADGTDTSWLWDVPFERLRGRRVVVSGERAADASVRLLYAGVEHTTSREALDDIRGADAPAWDVIANYTAFTRVRAQLAPHSGPR